MYQQGRIRISKGVFLQDLRRIWPGVPIGKKSGKQSTFLARFKMSLNLFNLGKFRSVPVLWLELSNNHHHRYRNQNGLVRETNLIY